MELNENEAGDAALVVVAANVAGEPPLTAKAGVALPVAGANEKEAEAAPNDRAAGAGAATVALGVATGATAGAAVETTGATAPRATEGVAAGETEGETGLIALKVTIGVVGVVSLADGVMSSAGFPGEAPPEAAAILARLRAVAETRREVERSPETNRDFTTGTLRLLNEAFSLATRSGEMTGRLGVVTVGTPPPPLLPPGEAWAPEMNPARALAGVDLRLAPLLPAPMSSVFIFPIKSSTD